MKHIKKLIIIAGTLMVSIVTLIVYKVCAQTAYTNYLDHKFEKQCEQYITERDGTQTKSVFQSPVTQLAIKPLETKDPLSEIKHRSLELHVIREDQGVTPAQKTTLIAIELDINNLIKLAQSYDVMCTGIVENGDLDSTYKEMLYVAVFGDSYK